MAVGVAECAFVSAAETRLGPSAASPRAADNLWHQWGPPAPDPTLAATSPRELPRRPLDDALGQIDLVFGAVDGRWRRPPLVGSRTARCAGWARPEGRVPASSGPRFTQSSAERIDASRVFGDRRPVAEAEHRERQLEQPLDAASRLVDVVCVLAGMTSRGAPVRGRAGPTRTRCPGRRRAERVLSRTGAGGEDGAQPSKLVAVLVADVRLLLEGLRERRRVHRDAELAPQPPRRALVAAGRQADRLDGAEPRRTPRAPAAGGRSGWFLRPS